jgi:hypothetical protein
MGISFFLLVAFYFPCLLRADIALALVRASCLEEAPQAFRDNNSLVGSPLELRSGPGILPMRARNEARRGLSPDFTGALSVPPVCFLYDARPAAFNPPLGFLPSARCHAADFGITSSSCLLPCCQSSLDTVCLLLRLSL